jgi:CDP-paratose 2-epimerase
VRLPSIGKATTVRASRNGRVVAGRDACLVTGGAGFIGCNLADRLLGEGRRVLVLDDFSRPGSRLNFDWLGRKHPGGRLTVVEGDVRDGELVREAVAGVGTVFHLAGQTAVTTSVADPQSDFDVNLGGTVAVLEAARARPQPPVVVYASTNKVYGDLEEQVVVEEPTRYVLPELPHGVPETMPLSFGSPYACSKGAADQYVLSYAHVYGLPAVVLRQSCVYGPHQLGMEGQGWVAWLLLAGALGRPATIYGDGKQVRDLLYVDDLVDAYLAAVEAISSASGRAFNIGGGPAYAVSIWHEFSELVRGLGYAVPRVEFAESRPGDQRVYVSDTRRATSELGWRPTVSVEDGLARLEDWVRSSAQSLGPLVGG